MSLCTIRFQVTCETNLGEVVYICGNTPQLGNWTPSNAMRLYTDSALYPKWDPYKPILVRQGNKLLFKVCIVGENHSIRWQSILHNREIIPSQNLLIEFTANYQQITVTSVVQQLPKPPRKKTCDILNELESDGSSSHEYWKQFMSEQEEESIMYITLLTQMRRIIEYGTQQQFIHYEESKSPLMNSQSFDSVLKMKIEKTCSIIKKTSHLYCIVEETQKIDSGKQLHRNGNSNKDDNSNSNKTDNNNSNDNKNSNHNNNRKGKQLISMDNSRSKQKQKDEVISVLGQQSYIVSREKFTQGYSLHNNRVPIIFHVENIKVGEQISLLEQIMETVKKMVHAQNILLTQKQSKLEYFISLVLRWEPNQHLIELMVKYRWALIIVHEQRILEKLLDLLVVKGLRYEGLGDDLIVVQIDYVARVTIKVSIETEKVTPIMTNSNTVTINNHSIALHNTINNTPSASERNLIDTYFTSIKHFLLSQSNKSYQHLGKEHYIDSLKEDDMFLGLGYHRKNILLINAESLNSLTPKILTEIIALSSKPNFEIFIILSKLNADIKSRFPASKTNKLVVVGKNGLLYANENILIDIVSNLSLQKGKLCDSISKIVSSITMGLESKTQPTTSCIESQLIFKSTTIGKLGLTLTQNKLKQHNQNASHYKLTLQEVNSTTYLLKPYIFTEEFYLRAILQNISKQVHDERVFIITVNFKNDNNYVHKLCNVFDKVFKGKYNARLRNMQILAENDQQYSFIGGEEIVTRQYIEGQLQFLCEHFLGSSGIKSYNLSMLSPQHKPHRRSFADKHLKQKHFDYSHENL